jgi:GAF domain-containing protein
MCKQGRDKQAPIALVAVAGSAGGGLAMREILAHLPADFPAPILYLQHLSASHLGALADVLQFRTALMVRWAQQGDRLRAGVVYLCPPGWSFLVRPDGTMTLAPLATRRDTLRAADRFFASVAASYAHRAAVIVLSGAGRDGTEGVCAVHAQHGTVLVQDEASAVVWGMPRAALATGCVDLVLPPQAIAPLLVNLVRDGQPLSALRASVATVLESPCVSVAPRLHDVLWHLLAPVLTMHRTDLGNLQLVDPQAGGLAIVTQRGFGVDFLTYFRTVGRQDVSACGRAMCERTPVLIPDVTTDPRFAVHRAIAEVARFRAVQSTPLMSQGGTLLGVLSTHFRQPRRLTQEELQRLARHARRAADRIERLRIAQCLPCS